MQPQKPNPLVWLWSVVIEPLLTLDNANGGV